VHIFLLLEGAILREFWCTLCYCVWEQYYGNYCAQCVIVGGNNIGKIVVHVLLLWEVALLGEFWCTWFYCGRKQNWGNCGALVVIVWGRILG
jgi:hypothetical protein